MSEESRLSTVERNRALAPLPDTLHGTRETWNDFERRVSSLALPLGPSPLDARVTRGGGGGGGGERELSHNTWKYYLTFRVIALGAY